MAKYDEGFKLAVVQEYLAGDLGLRSLANKRGTTESMIRSWVRSYAEHGVDGLRKKFSHYSAEFKLSVLKKMWQDELSGRQVVALFDIRGGCGVVSAWERLYHQGGLPALHPKPRGRRKKRKWPPSPRQNQWQINHQRPVP